jgi:uncharacterized membrane protein YbhN (UPF0104 family)
MKTAIGILTFAGFAALIEYLYGWSVLIRPWALIPPAAVAAALVLTFASYALRAARVYDYFRSDVGGFAPCLKLTLLHNLLNNLLPARSGELSFPALMRRYFGVPVTRSMTGLVWFRTLDLHLLITVALPAGLWFWSGWAPLVAALWLPVPWLLFHAGGRLRARLMTPATRMQRLAHAVLHALPQDSRAFWRDWGWTFASWAVKLGAFAWVLMLFLPMPPGAAVWGAVAGDLTTVLPVHGVAGAGTYEAGVIAGLLPFGIAAREALQAAVNLHIFLLGATMVGGMLSVLIQRGTARTPRAAETERWM